MYICIFVCIYTSASVKIGFQRPTPLRIQFTKNLLRIYHCAIQYGRYQKIQPKPETEEYNSVPHICLFALELEIQLKKQDF